MIRISLICDNPEVENDMKNRTFFDLDHANRYLTHSIIRVGNTPVFVNRINPSNDNDVNNSELVCNPVKYLNRERKIKLSDPRVDMNPIPTGFVNYQVFGNPIIAINISRIPIRGWKIGLHDNNAHFSALGIDQLGGLPARKRIFMSAGFHDMVNNKYPSVEECLNSIQSGDAKSYAFSRKFALSSMRISGDNLSLFYNQIFHQPVGSVVRGQLNLFTEFQYLAELLTMEVNHEAR